MRLGLGVVFIPDLCIRPFFKHSSATRRIRSGVFGDLVNYYKRINKRIISAINLNR